jgi:hypothetical protein
VVVRMDGVKSRTQARRRCYLGHPVQVEFSSLVKHKEQYAGRSLRHDTLLTT